MVAKDIGGTTGRQIQFLAHTGQAFVRPVPRVDEMYEEDIQKIRRSARAAAAEETRVVLF